MVTNYSFALWNGKEIVGYYHTLFKILDETVTFHEVSLFKQEYNKKPKTFSVPVIFVTEGMGTPQIKIDVMLDVRRKSKRQIEFIKHAVR